MIRVTLRIGADRDVITVPATQTIRATLESRGVDYSIGVTNLDGAPLKAGDLDRTFADFGIREHCYLINVVKADGANR